MTEEQRVSVYKDRYKVEIITEYEEAIEMDSDAKTDISC